MKAFYLEKGGILMDINSTVTLNNGIKMPLFGLGVFKAEDGTETENAVKWAIDEGYKSIDTAKIYGNESSVGQGIKASGVAREDIFLTTKVWNSDQGYETTLEAFEKSLKLLETDYVDLYLIHWPVTGEIQATWKALEEIYESGRAKAIGVSNFHKQHIEKLLETANITPMVNQIELHPYLNQKELRAYCQSKGIVVEAWSPLARGEVLNDSVLKDIAKKHHKSVAQIVIRWDLQNGIVTIPKSVNQERIKQNAEVFDFELSLEEMTAINKLDKGYRSGTNPDTFEI